MLAENLTLEKLELAFPGVLEDIAHDTHIEMIKPSPVIEASFFNA